MFWPAVALLGMVATAGGAAAFDGSAAVAAPGAASGPAPAAITVPHAVGAAGSVAVPAPGPLAAAPPPAAAGKPSAVTAAKAATMTPIEAFQAARAAYREGDKAAAVTSLEFAATHGHAGAQWMLGRMYAEGDGVAHNDIKAFDYFRDVIRLASAADFPDSRKARADAPYVSSALVWLGSYYLEGIPGTDIKPTPKIAFRLFSDAAYNYGDPNAEYNLARMFLDGTDVPRDTAQALRWLNLAARKGHAPSRALLGHLLFEGQVVPRQPARGLMLMALARRQAEKANTPADKWMIDLHEKALAQATAEERASALADLTHWIKRHGED
jgi:TPR repeat protein